MPGRLSCLKLRCFRSIRLAKVELDNPTFLVGANGSGKSNFVDAFSILSDVMAIPLQAVFDQRGGIGAVRTRQPGRGFPPNLIITAELEGPSDAIRAARFAFEVKALPDAGFEVVREQCVVRFKDGTSSHYDRDSNPERRGGKRPFHSSEQGLDPSIALNSLVLPAIAGHPRFEPVSDFLRKIRHYSIEPSKLREMQDPDGGSVLRADGRNAASVLREIERHSQADWEQACAFLAAAVPHTSSVEAKPFGNKIALEFTQEWDNSRKVKFGGFSMSDGTLRILGLLTAVFQRERPSVLVVEEPESSIHPAALDTLLEILETASRRMQVVVTTHSPDLLDHRLVTAENLRIVSWNEGRTDIGKVSPDAIASIRDGLMGAGELLRAERLDADPEFFSMSPGSQRNFFEIGF
ncbi:MAG: AAA family ATPase [Isosphaeraceae bacterium]|nr:AAA family ATPase [Isosphaeraceae bacterium]